MKYKKENSFNRGFFYYLQQSYLVYECKMDSFNFNSKKISKWKSMGIFIYSDDSKLKVLKTQKQSCQN